MRLAHVTAILLASLLAACSGSHSAAAASSPLAKQLVGHWSTPGDDNLYFGALDPSTKIGSYVLVHPDGKVFEHRYELKSADLGSRTLKVNLKFADGDSRVDTYVISQDGNTIETTVVVTGIEVHSQLYKVDDKTAP